jgi:TP901 family phage tail tape measure protein
MIAAAKLLVTVGSDISGAQTGLKQVEAQIDRFSASAERAGKVLSIALTAPIMMIGKQAVDAVAEYDRAMGQMAVASKASSAELQAMDQLAKDLGRDLTLPGTSASDAATAMLELSKAGLSVTDTMEAARGVLQLSAAGMISNERAAEVTAGALNAFSLEGQEAVRVADLLAAGANASMAEVEGMADSLQMSAAVAATTGMAIEDLVTMISEMANAGIAGSDAGTSLKQMMLSLQAPTDKAAELMAELGIKIYDSQGAMLGIRDIIDQFSSKLSGLTEAQRNAALATIFGSDAVRAANIVLMGGVEAFDSMKTAVTEQGAAAEMAAAQMTGMAGALEGLRSAWETGLLEAGQAASDIIIKVIDKVTQLITWFSGLEDAQQEQIVMWIGIAAAAGPVLIILSKIAPIVMGAVGAMLAFGQSAAAAIQAWQAGLTLSTSLQVGFGGIMATLGPLAVAVGVAAGAWALYNATIGKTAGEMEKLQKAKVGDFFSNQAPTITSAQAAIQAYLDVYRQFNQEMQQKSGWEKFASIFMRDADDAKAAAGELGVVLSGLGGDYRDYLAAVMESATGLGHWTDVNTEATLATYDAGKSIGDFAVNTLGLMTEAEFEASKETQGLTNLVEGLGGAASITAAGMEASNANLQQFIESAQAFAVPAEDMTAQLEKLNAEMDALALSEGIKAGLDAGIAGTLSGIIDAYTQAMDGNAEAQRNAEEAMRAATTQMLYQQAAAGLSAEAALALGRAMGVISEQDYQVASTIGALKVQFAGLDGVMDPTEIEGFTAAMANMNIATQNVITQGLPATMENILAELENMADLEIPIPEWGGDIGDELGPAVNQAHTAVKSELKKVGEDVAKAAAAVGDTFATYDWKSVGSAVDEGIALGISGGVEKVTSAARLVAKEALAAAMSELGIHSPSKEFMKIGAYVAEGMALGMNENAILAAQAGRDMANMALVGAGSNYYQTSSSNTYSSSVNVNAAVSSDIDTYRLAQIIADEIRTNRM